MKYCARCILPDSRPNLRLDAENVCNACRSFERRASIDWKTRAREFARVAENAKARSTGYDCIVPVSGGKDSHWQVLTCLEHGLTPLAVTWRPPKRTALGQKNLDNLIRLGVDHVDFTINPKTERAFTRLAFERYGTPGLPMHMALFNIPLNLAVRYSIPLVVWGENSAFEYGEKEERDTGFRLDARWLKTYGVTHGTTAEDWVSEELPRQGLLPYFGPDQEELDAARVNAVFLGYYFPWNPKATRDLAMNHGFEQRVQGPITGHWEYADIDDELIAVHHWMKWYKFGFTRLFDNLSIEIRNGFISRDQAVDMVRADGCRPPAEAVDRFCDYTGMTAKRFHEVAESFRNTDVWERDGGGWRIPGFLLPNWSFA